MTPTKNESLPELVARWRSAATQQDMLHQRQLQKGRDIDLSHGICRDALNCCADELEAALTREAPTEGVGEDITLCPQHGHMYSRGCAYCAGDIDALANAGPGIDSDLMAYGVAYTLDGKRIDPRNVVVHTVDTPPAPQRLAQGEEFGDPDFIRWLDDAIADGGHVVRDAIKDVGSAWHGWSAHGTYSEQARTFDATSRLLAEIAIIVKPGKQDSALTYDDLPEKVRALTTQPPHQDRGEVEQRARELLDSECPECGGGKGFMVPGDVGQSHWHNCGTCRDGERLYSVNRAQALRAITAALTEAKKQGPGEAVYQSRDAYGAWRDTTKTHYDTETQHDTRVLYTAPQVEAKRQAGGDA